MKREFLQNLKVGDQPLSKEVIDAIMEENGKDTQSAKLWQEKYNQAVAQHQKELSDARFTQVLEQEIFQAKGRNAKAITALLNVDTLKESENQQCAAKQAVQALKEEHGYLFDETETPPPYARGTGAQVGAIHKEPASLADALKARYAEK